MKLNRILSQVTAITSIAVFLVASAVAPRAAADPQGPPPRPPVGQGPDTSLTAHTYSYADTPVGQPLKGFAPYLFPGSNYNEKYPGGLMWSYFALSEVMSDPSSCNVFDWSAFDKALDEAAVWGRQLVFRFYVEYPDGGTGSHPGNGTPPCLDGEVEMRTNGYWGTVSPDYDDPDTIDAFTNFINAFAARYDTAGPGATADPRIGFMSLGLVGLWGEWHTWPYDRDPGDGYPDLMPSDATIRTLIEAYDQAFDNIQLEVRYPYLAGADTADIGFHDDSWPYREWRNGELKSLTLPVSMSGWADAFTQLLLDAGIENRWTSQSIGGEARPEIQGSLYAAWPAGSGQVDDVLAVTELTHISWMINETGAGSYSVSDPNVAAGVRRMGYTLHIPQANFDATVSGNFRVGVTIENRGVAPFYYPWTVQLGLRDSAGVMVQSWDTNWDIRQVQPLQIRAFPDWNVGADPSYVEFGRPINFSVDLNAAGLPEGDYELVLRVRNPLEAVTPGVLRSRPAASRLADSVIDQWRPPYPLSFANANQGADGWMNLGDLALGGCAGDCVAPTAPVVVLSDVTDTTASLSWSGAADNMAVTGYEVFRDGTLIESLVGAAYTDSGLASSTDYEYAVKAVDAAGNRSPVSNTVAVTTDDPPPVAGLVLDDYDGDPPWPSSARNDLGKWTGGNCFLNGDGAAEVSGGGLVLSYDNCGWFGSDVAEDLTGYTYLVVRIRGAAGGEQDHFNLSLGGASKLFSGYVLDGGNHPVITTSYRDIRIPMADNGINRNVPPQLIMSFWHGGVGTVIIDSIHFE